MLDHGYAGRHVLTELVKEPFIANDTNMELSAGRIQVLLKQSHCDGNLSLWVFQSLLP